MKKIFITAMILLINASLFLSCSKSSTTPSTPVVVTGYWYGTYSSVSNNGSAGIAFDASGNAVVYNFATTGSTDTASCPLKYTGSYQVKGTEVDFVVTTPSLSTLNYKSTANLTTNPNTLSGTFSSTGGVSGNFFVTKQ